MSVCAEASTGEQAVALYRERRPDVMLMDLRLPGISGSEATQAIRDEFPDARIIVLSTYAGDEEIYLALQAGAMAYLLKSVQREELVQAIRKAAAGQRHIPPEIAARLAGPRAPLAALRARARRAAASSSRASATRRSPSALDITEGTVKIHVSSILCKLGVSDRTEAVTVALQRGIVPARPLAPGPGPTSCALHFPDRTNWHLRLP